MANGIVISTEDYERFKALDQREAKRVAKEKRKEDLRTLEQIEDSIVRELKPILLNLEGVLKAQKNKVYEKCKEYIDFRNELYPTRATSKSVTLLTLDKENKIMLKTNIVKRYTDTSKIGVQMIMDYVQSLIKEGSDQELVEILLAFLTPDNQGNLQANLIAELKKTAIKFKNDTLIEAVRIIEDASYMQDTSTSIYFWIKDSIKGGMRPVVLGMRDDIYVKEELKEDKEEADVAPAEKNQ